MSEAADAETDPNLKKEAGEVCDLLDSFFEKFQTDFTAKCGLEIELVPQVIQNVALSYTHDLHRYKTYHEVALPDKARRAAYLCKWIMKMRPIKVVSEYRKGVRRYHLMVNEIFALDVAGGTLGIDLGKSLSTRMLGILLYSLRYRAATEDTFILYFGSLCGLK